jgi:hypothetical protein
VHPLLLQHHSVCLNAHEWSSSMADRIPPDTNGLQPVEGFPFDVYVSPGGAERGRVVAERARRTSDWLADTVGGPPLPPVFVVGKQQWHQVATYSGYGVVHVAYDRVVIGQEQPEFWSVFTDMVWPKISQERRQAVLATFGGELDLARFADLFVSHEISHLSHGSVWGQASTFWVWELFADLGMLAYFSEVESEHLAVLDAFIEAAWSSSVEWPVHELERIREPVEGHGDAGVGNYVWFQVGLTVLAKRLWKVGGAEGFRRFRDMLAGPPLSTAQIADVLAEIDPAVGQAVRDWPRISFAD